jgi:hypothetical protein
LKTNAATQPPLPTRRDGTAPAGEGRAPTPSPAVEPWPAPASSTPRGATASAAHAERTALDGRYAVARCQPGPLFTRFGARPDNTDPDEGVRL